LDDSTHESEERSPRTNVVAYECAADLNACCSSGEIEFQFELSTISIADSATLTVPDDQVAERAPLAVAVVVGVHVVLDDALHLGMVGRQRGLAAARLQGDVHDREHVVLQEASRAG